MVTVDVTDPRGLCFQWDDPRTKSEAVIETALATEPMKFGQRPRIPCRPRGRLRSKQIRLFRLQCEARRAYKVRGWLIDGTCSCPNYLNGQENSSVACREKATFDGIRCPPAQGSAHTRSGRTADPEAAAGPRRDQKPCWRLAKDAIQLPG